MGFHTVCGLSIGLAIEAISLFLLFCDRCSPDFFRTARAAEAAAARPGLSSCGNAALCRQALSLQTGGEGRDESFQEDLPAGRHVDVGVFLALADKPGSYTAQLIVNDGALDSAPDTVTVNTENSRPVANAGADQAALPGTTVTLDGGKSSDVDGDLLTFHWSFSELPAGSCASISSPEDVNPTFHVDKPGVYVARLIVNDGRLDSEASRATISTENVKPFADAGLDSTVPLEGMVTLDGSGSSDADGDQLEFKRSFAAKPPGSVAALSDPFDENPSFYVDEPRSYALQLIVNDGELDSEPSTVVITTENSRPRAEAGLDRHLAAGEDVALDGSGSGDSDNDPLSYRWSLIHRPSGSNASLFDSNTPTPWFPADLEGTYLVQLIVNDGNVSSDPDTVRITAGLLMASVPNVVGMAMEEAEALILSAGLITGVVDASNSNAVSSGRIISQDPAPGALAPAGAGVNLVVSLGPDLPVSPDIGLVTVGEVIGGESILTGAPDCVASGLQVEATNLATDETRSVTASADGSFTLLMPAWPADKVSLISVNQAGNASALPPLRPGWNPQSGCGHLWKHNQEDGIRFVWKHRPRFQSRLHGSLRLRRRPL